MWAEEVTQKQVSGHHKEDCPDSDEFPVLKGSRHKWLTAGLCGREIKPRTGSWMK